MIEKAVLYFKDAETGKLCQVLLNYDEFNYMLKHINNSTALNDYIQLLHLAKIEVKKEGQK